MVLEIKLLELGLTALKTGAEVSKVTEVTLEVVALLPAASCPSKAMVYTAPSTSVGALVSAAAARVPAFNSLPVRFTTCGDEPSAVPLVRVKVTVPEAMASDKV